MSEQTSGDDGLRPTPDDGADGSLRGKYGGPVSGESGGPVGGESGTADRAVDRDVDEQIGELIGRLSGDEELDREARGRLLARLGRLVAARMRTTGAKGLAGGRWMSELFAEVAPRITVRDLETMRLHHRGPVGEPLAGERLADSVVRGACNGTTAVGVAGGALATVEFVAPPLLLSAPAVIVAETLVVAAIEVKLIAELHEVYGVQVPGTRSARAKAFTMAWAKQHGIDSSKPAQTMGTAAKAVVRERLLTTAIRLMSTMVPFLAGALVGGALNRSATRKLGELIRMDLRRIVSPVSEHPRSLPEPP